MTAVTSDRERLIQIQERWNAYLGRMPRPLRVSRNQQGVPLDDNVILPLPQIIVDKGRSALFGEDVEADI